MTSTLEEEEHIKAILKKNELIMSSEKEEQVTVKLLIKKFETSIKSGSLENSSTNLKKTVGKSVQKVMHYRSSFVPIKLKEKITYYDSLIASTIINEEICGFGDNEPETERDYETFEENSAEETAEVVKENNCDDEDLYEEILSVDDREFQQINHESCHKKQNCVEIKFGENQTVRHRGNLTHIISELKETEKHYINGLRKILEDYKPHMPESYNHLVLSNLDKLFAGAKDFLADLERCGNDAESVAETFVKHENLFNKYPEYCENKPHADVHITNFRPFAKILQKRMGDKLNLEAYLITPIQRLGKYTLLLESIDKQLQKLRVNTKAVLRALNIIRNVMRKGNHALAISSIDNCPFSLTDFGKYIMREKFTCLKPKKIGYMVFLFKEIIVFTTQEIANLEKFLYADSIKMSRLLPPVNFESKVFELAEYCKVLESLNNKSKHFLQLEAPSIFVKQKWLDIIEEILWQELKRAKEGGELSTEPLPEDNMGIQNAFEITPAGSENSLADDCSIKFKKECVNGRQLEIIYNNITSDDSDNN